MYRKLDAKDLLCTGCGACVNKCANDAIEYIYNYENDGSMVAQINEEKCVSCHLCETVCPVLTEHSNENQVVDECYAVWANDEVRMQSSSGGVFTVLAEEMLDRGGYVCAVAYGSNFKAEHIIISDKKELYKLRRSKYMQSDVGFVYRRVEELLKRDKEVMFVGTPCQVAGIKAYLGQTYKKLLLVDIYCNYTPAYPLFEKYLNENYNVNNIEKIEFRIKKYGWFCDIHEVTYKSGKIEEKREYNDDFQRGYHSKLFLRETCEKCKFAGNPRQGDLSIADFWHIGEFCSELDDAKKDADKARDRANASATDAKIKLASVTEIRNSIIEQAGRKFDDPEDIDGLPEKVEKNIGYYNEKIADTDRQIEAERKRVSRRDELAAKLPQEEEAFAGMQVKLAELERNISALTAKVVSDREQATELAAGLRFRNRSEAETKMNEILGRAKKLQNSFDAAEKRYNAVIQDIKTLEGQIKALTDTLESAEKLELAKLEEDKTAVRDELGRIRLLMQDGNSRIRANETAMANISRKSDELLAKEKEYVSVKSLYDTASGNVSGKNKINLEAYIQMSYFDRIIQRANLRFLKMSDGQYELSRVTDSSDKRSQIGLDLCVVDHYNGSRRDVKSLSGGESFMASLSLALGLSDEVQASAGGIQIDTMFVDEGFGSLDTEKTLPQAYKALVSVTEGRKLVGIISHVTELKEKIDKQIVVEKDRTGRAKARLVV